MSHESIYRFIYRPRIRREKLHRYLPRAKATRGRRYFKRRREPIPGRRSIHERQQSVDVRQEFGHWAGDLLQFRTQRGHLLTLCERITRLTLAAHLMSKTAEATQGLLRTIFSCLPEAARQSITFDNLPSPKRSAGFAQAGGGEFAQHQKLTDHLAMKTWFCDPHSPWRRGAIENANGILRRDLPRKTELRDYRPHDIHDIVWTVNSTPRRCLGYLTPAEAFINHLRCCT